MLVSQNQRTDMLTNMFRDFDRLMEARATPALRSPPVRDNEHHSLAYDESERLKFGFDKGEWKEFLRRLGMDEEVTSELEKD
jgi:hypothetical protein